MCQSRVFLTGILAVGVFACSGKSEKSASNTSSAAVRVEAENEGLRRVLGPDFEGWLVVLPEDGKTATWSPQAAQIESLEAGMGSALAEAIANGQLPNAPEGLVNRLPDYRRRYAPFKEPNGERRMFIDLYCEQAAANANRGREAPIDLQGAPPGCFVRVVYDVTGAQFRRWAVR